MFSFQNADYVQNEAVNLKSKGYVDKAEERRKTKGSDNPYEKDAAPTSSEMYVCFFVYAVSCASTRRMFDPQVFLQREELCTSALSEAFGPI